MGTWRAILQLRGENYSVARVLLTGSSGGVGRAARPVLEAAGWAVEPFDLADGQDLRDEAAVLRDRTGPDSWPRREYCLPKYYFTAELAQLKNQRQGQHGSGCLATSCRAAKNKGSQ